MNKFESNKYLLVEDFIFDYKMGAIVFRLDSVVFDFGRSN